MDAEGMQRLIKEFNLQANVTVYTKPILPTVALAKTKNPNMGHWVYIEESENGNDVLLFDSYGIGPGDLYTIPHFAPTKPVVFSTITGQRLGTVYCGVFCVGFIKLRQTLSWVDAIAYLFPEHGSDRNNITRLAKVLGRSPDALLRENGFTSETRIT